MVVLFYLSISVGCVFVAMYLRDDHHIDLFTVSSRDRCNRNDDHGDIATAVQIISGVINGVTVFIFDQIFESTLDDMSEMVIQWGYINLFVVRLTLTPLLALINNIIEMKVDGHALVYDTKRTISIKNHGMGVCIKCLHLIAIVNTESVDRILFVVLHITAPHQNEGVDIEYSFFIFICCILVLPLGYFQQQRIVILRFFGTFDTKSGAGIQEKFGGVVGETTQDDSIGGATTEEDDSCDSGAGDQTSGGSFDVELVTYYCYPKKWLSIPFISQSHKIFILYINIPSATIDNLNPICLSIDICNRVQKECYTIDQITIELDICNYDIVDAITFIIDALIQVSIFASFLYILTVVFDGFNLNFDKSNEFECGRGNNSEVTVILRNTCAIRGTTDLVGFYLVNSYFITHGMDESPSNVLLSVEFYLIVIIIIQMIAYLAIQSSVNAVHCYTQVIHNVCGVFYYLFFILCIFWNLQM